MHELGLVFEVVKTVERVAKEENVSSVRSITLQVGELSLVIPSYLEDCFPAAIDKKPLFADTELVIETIPGMARCDKCGKEFNVIINEGYCPECKSFDKTILSGREFLIKEILAD